MGEGQWDKDTEWPIIRAAGTGNGIARSVFAARYLPLIRLFFRARWRSSPLIESVEDAVQEVFMECFRGQGVLQKADPRHPGGFRALLRGVARNVALRVERRSARREAHLAQVVSDLDEVEKKQQSISDILDHSWAEKVLLAAEERLSRQTLSDGVEGRELLQLLKLRFKDGLRVREIAARLGADPADIHEALRRAKRHFRRCLREIVAASKPGSPEEIEHRCLLVLSLL